MFCSFSLKGTLFDCGLRDKKNKKNKKFIYLQLNEAKCNERDDKWFLEFPSEMIECGSVVIVNMCEAWEVCECKDASI